MPRLSAATSMLLDRATESLARAEASTYPAERFVQAHLSGLRAAAAVLAGRGRPSPRGGPRSVWEVLPGIAPQFTVQAARFGETATLRARVEAGRGDLITATAADALVADARVFVEECRAFLEGLGPNGPHVK